MYVAENAQYLDRYQSDPQKTASSYSILMSE
jgi:hypothetical protein